MAVERGKVREFRAATASQSPFQDAAPPTFPSNLGLEGPSSNDVMVELGYDLLHVLHGEERLRYHDGPPQVGEVLDGTIAVVGVDHKAGRSGPLDLVHLRLELFRADGRLAVTIDRTLVSLRPPKQPT